jgi:DNA repair protein RadC
MTDDPDLRLQLFGPDVLSDAELLSFFLTRGGPPGQDASRTARAVLARAGSLAGIGRLVEGELCEVHGIGPSKARRVLALGAIGRRLSERPLPRGARLDHPRLVYESVRGRLGRSDREHFLVLPVDSRGRKLAEVEVGRGGRSRVALSPRDVFEVAVREGAEAVLLVHNHPSGDPTPSPSDVALTHRLQAAGELLGIGVLDHVVIGDGSYCSMAEAGQLAPAPTGFRAAEVADSPRRAGDQGSPRPQCSAPPVWWREPNAAWTADAHTPGDSPVAGSSQPRDQRP